MTAEQWVSIITAFTALMVAVAGVISAWRGHSVINGEIRPAVTKLQDQAANGDARASKDGT